MKLFMIYKHVIAGGSMRDQEVILQTIFPTIELILFHYCNDPT